MRALALDLGSRCGWAFWAGPTSLIESGVARFRDGSRHGYGARFLDFRRWLAAMKDSHGFDRLFYEDVRRHVATDAAHAYGGYLATLAAFGEAHEIPYIGIGVGVWKKHLTGRGDATKLQVLAKIRAEGWKPADDNEADALGLLEFVLRDPALDPPAAPRRKRRRAPAAPPPPGLPF